jgi:hypothetical protein
MDVIEVHTTPRLRNVYVVVGDRVTLVRLEDHENNLVRRYYTSKLPYRGPAHPEKTATEWIQSLDSEDPVEVLETLVWLSGEHLSSDEERKPNYSQESVENSILFETVRDSPLVKQKLLNLKESPNIWIRQAAELAIACQ